MTGIPVYMEHRKRDVGSGVYEIEFQGQPLASASPGAPKPPPCIVAHGAGVGFTNSLEMEGANGYNGVSSLIEELSEAYTVVYALLGGDLWGSATHVARIESARTYLASIGSTGPVTLVGYSMGHTGITNYAIANPTNVRCLVAIEGVQDIANLYSRFPGAPPSGFTQTIDAAYPGGSSVYVPRSPINLAASLSAYNIPVCELFCQNDSIVLPATTRTFVDNYLTAIGSSLTPIWASGNNGAGQKSVVGNLSWKELGAYDHTDAAILAGTPDAVFFAKYLRLA